MHCCLWGHVVYTFKIQSIFSREDLPFYFPTSSIVCCLFVFHTLGNTWCLHFLFIYFFKFEPLRHILPFHCGILCCMSQITDVEDLFMCLFVIYILSSVKNLFMYSANFLFFFLHFIYLFFCLFFFLFIYFY